MIHPFLRRADTDLPHSVTPTTDSSPPTKGRRFFGSHGIIHARFIPSYEGQARRLWRRLRPSAIHPFLRRAGFSSVCLCNTINDSSLPTKGRHSVFMRLSAALNTSLCNLHKCHSCLIRIFNMPKNPPHFHFF